MKKKISLLICMLIAVLALSGCGNEKAELEYDKASVEQATEFLINYCASADEATIEQWGSMTEFALESQLMQAGLPFTPESFLTALEAWKAGEKECGAYLEHGDYTFEASAKELKVTTEAVYEDRNATLEFAFNDKMYLESMDVSAEFTISEILKKAGLNTLLGMGTVFAVLIFISIIISLFRFIPALEAALAGKSKKESATPSAVPEVAATQTERLTDDAELVAVIASAIAACEGTTTDGFVVRSIKRRKSNKWN